MSIVLSEIRDAVQTYLNTKVNLLISDITPDFPPGLNAGEQGTYALTASNSAPDSIRLVNVRYHIRTSNATFLQLKVPPASTGIAYAGSSENSAVLQQGTFVAEMFLFLEDNTLDALDTDVITGLKVKAGNHTGDSYIIAQIYAEPDEAFLFAKTFATPGVSRVVSVRPTPFSN